MIKKILFILLVISYALLSNEAYSQSKNRIAISTGFLQIKDDFNQGMVFDGAMINFQYQRSWNFSSVELLYKPKIALGMPFDKGIMAVNIDFAPIDISCFAPVYNSEQQSIEIGLNFATNYSYQSYPDLHAGRLFWFSEIGLSPVVKYRYRWSESIIGVNLQNSLLGFVSRPTDYNPYFYSLKLTDFFTNPHKDMQFGSFNKYNHTNLQIEYIPNVLKTNSFALGVEYIGVYYGEHFKSLNYYLQWKKVF